MTTLIDILWHDILSVILKNLKLDDFINLTMCSKRLTNLFNHSSFKNFFLEQIQVEANVDPQSIFYDSYCQKKLSKKLSINDKIIKYLCDNKIVNHHTYICNKNGPINIISYLTKVTDKYLEKLVVAILNKNIHQLYYFTFINQPQADITLSEVYQVFKKYSLEDKLNVFVKKIFGMNVYDDSLSDYKLRYPWLTVPLIMNYFFTIKYIFETYVNSNYLHFNSPFEGFKMVYYVCDFGYVPNLKKILNDITIEDFIKTEYPEFNDLCTMISNKETIKMNYWLPKVK